MRRHAVEGRDYVTMEWRALCGLVVCNYVIDKKYADLKGLQKITLENEAKVYETDDEEAGFRFSNIFDASRVSYSGKHNIDKVVNEIAEDMKRENSGGMKGELREGITDTELAVEMVEYYSRKEKPEEVTGSSKHAQFMKELTESNSFKHRLQLSASTLNPMLAKEDSESVVEQVTGAAEVSDEFCASEELVLASRKADKLLADGKRKSFVNVFKTWEVREQLEANHTTPAAASTGNVSSASNTMSLFGNVNKAKNLLLKSVKK